MTIGTALITGERGRQIEGEGWTAAHDDLHDGGQMAKAGAMYALPERFRSMCALVNVPTDWPWSPEWWKPTPSNRVRELVKAGALIAAEIDRLIRLVPDFLLDEYNEPTYFGNNGEFLAINSLLLKEEAARLLCEFERKLLSPYDLNDPDNLGRYDEAYYLKNIRRLPLFFDPSAQEGCFILSFTGDALEGLGKPLIELWAVDVS